jgi:hypothetical protein
MTTEDFAIELFCRIDDNMHDIPKHSQAKLYPSEVVTLGILFSQKGVHGRAFYRWITRDFRHLFPKIPDRTRLFRLFKAHSNWTNRFLAKPSVLGIIDTYGIEFIHPIREGRTPNQIGKKGVSNHRWIVGGKLCLLLNQWGSITAWDCDTANVHDTTFQHLIEQFEDIMIVLGDSGFHAKTDNPKNLKICERGKWNTRMVIETVLSMLTTICHFKKLFHRIWGYFKATLGFTMAAFNILTQWNPLKPDKNGFINLSIAEFSL